MMGDLNENINSIEKKNSEIEKNGLLNVLEYRNLETLPKTQNRGKQAIYHLWVTENLITSIISLGILPFESGFTSDHRPLFMDISIPTFYSTTNIQVNNRILHNNNSTNVEKYLASLNNIFKKIKIYGKNEEIKQDLEMKRRKHEIKRKMSILDKIITK